MNYRFLGYTTDGLLLYQYRDYPSDAPQAYPDDGKLRGCSANDRLLDGDKYFTVTERQAEVRGLLSSTMGE